jgi:hypothetical protein
MLKRAASWRDNQQQARWLLTYVCRWIWCGLLLDGMGSVLELTLNAPALSACFYVPGAPSVPVNALIGAAWFGLKALPGPF